MFVSLCHARRAPSDESEVDHALKLGIGLPAQIVGLTDRGYVREGQAADLVIFDYERVQDHATITNPGGHNDGIDYVFVNGEAVVENGRVTGALPGEVLIRHAP